MIETGFKTEIIRHDTQEDQDRDDRLVAMVTVDDRPQKIDLGYPERLSLTIADKFNGIRFNSWAVRIIGGIVTVDGLSNLVIPPNPVNTLKDIAAAATIVGGPLLILLSENFFQREAKKWLSISREADKFLQGGVKATLGDTTRILG